MKTNNGVRRRSLLVWNQRALTIGGIWPMEKTYIRCNIWIIYLAVQLALGIVDMFYVTNDVILFSLSFSERIVQLMVIVKLIVLRYNSASSPTIAEFERTFFTNFYRSPEEEKLYISYYNLAKRFYIIMMILGTGTPICYHLMPLEALVRSAVNNETWPALDLPYRAHLFFTIKTARIYFLIYTYFTPMIYLNALHTASVCLLITLVLHVCGQLSVLAHRIKSIEVTSESDSKIVFRRIVEDHLEIIRLVKSLHDTFGLLLLEELIATTLMLGITSYILLVCLETDHQAGVTKILTFTTWTAAAVIVIYSYCFAGECLIDESLKVHDAYYHTIWYSMPKGFKSPLLICMIRAQTPLRLKAAMFYHFSLSNFTSIMKTAMAYVSLLRTVA